MKGIVKEKLMSQNKNAYFQNGQGKDNPNTPTPKKKKYKSEKAIVVQPRFEEPLYRNYDLYNVPGKHGPGAGWHDMHKFKSIKEFLEHKRKKLKGKYKANDSWIEDDGSRTKNKKMADRMYLFGVIIKKAIDFKLDEYSDPTLGAYDHEHDNSTGRANKGGGFLSEYLPEDDFEGKSPEKLDFGRDYADEPLSRNEKESDLEDIINKLIEKYHTKESPLMGLPNGIKPEEDLDADYTVNDINPEYGTTDLGNHTYERLSY